MKKLLKAKLHPTSFFKASSYAQMLGFSSAPFREPIQNPKVALVITRYLYENG